MKKLEQMQQRIKELKKELYELQKIMRSRDVRRYIEWGEKKDGQDSTGKDN